jgi:hypothetical protein
VAADDDDLERRIRNVLRGRHLGVTPDPDALGRIHAGARRRQQRRSAGAVLGAVAIIGVVASGIALRQQDHSSTVAAGKSTPSPVASVLPSSIASPPPTSAAPASAAPASSAAPTSPLAEPATSQSAAANQPGGFSPVSVSAISVNSYWVLGYTSTKTSDGYDVSTTIKQTTDAGKTFVADASPDAFVGQAPISLPPQAPTIAEIRFGDAKDGWTFGSTLFETTDGGASWSAVGGIPGPVIDLVASNGTAWAIVQTASSSNASSPAVADQYALWSTSYGTTTQAWAPVALPIALGSVAPSIVDQDGTVTLMAAGPARAGNRVHVLIAPPGKAFADHTGPCEQDLGGTLSNSKTAIWAECPHGNGASLWLSTDEGANWTSTNAIEVETGAALGAIDSTTAVVFDAANQLLTRISGDVATPTALRGIDDIAFVGFTNPTVGFAVTIGDDLSSQLQRTTDGGQTWTVVNLAGRSGRT